MSLVILLFRFCELHRISRDRDTPQTRDVIWKNMKWTYALVCLTMCGIVMGTEYYSDIYDTVDVDAILKSERLTNQYIACLLDNGPCTADGRSLKHTLPDAIATQCTKCNDRQKQIAKTICKFIKTNRPDEWILFLDKYDPDREYIDRFEEFLNKE